jgi:4-hydroxybenzoate polyprenyltransferase
VPFLLALLLRSDQFAALLALYVVTTTAYSIYLKRVAVLDVLVLAKLYTLRVQPGGHRCAFHLAPRLLDVPLPESRSQATPS